MTDELKQIPVPKSKDFKLDSIDNVNHNPHPYCITPKHLSSDRMYLDNDAIKEAEKKGAHCGMYTSPDGKQYVNNDRLGWIPCSIPYDEHTSDKVLFIKALVNKEVKDLYGLRTYLKRIKPIMKKLKIDGVAFIGPDKNEKLSSKR